MPDTDLNRTSPEDRTAPITVYLSDVLDLEHLDASALDSLDLALKSDGPFTVEWFDDGRVCLYGVTPRNGKNRTLRAFERGGRKPQR